MPLVQLPHTNPTGSGCGRRLSSAAPHRQLGGCPPPTTFTDEILGIIEELDAEMFDVWGYARRQAPFEM